MRSSSNSDSATPSAIREGVELTEHPAEVGIRAWAGSRERCVELALRGLVSIMTDPERAGSSLERCFAIEARDDRDLLRRALSEALYLMSEGDLFFSSFVVTRDSETSVSVRCRGEPIDPERHELRTEVKAITPSGLSLARHGDAWTATALVDV